MNNALYEKTMKNLRNRKDVELLSNNIDQLNRHPKTKYLPHKILGNDLVVIPKKQNFSKPAYICICSLEISKVLMYEFHYDYIKNKYDNNSRLLFTDIDSLVYDIRTEDVYENCSNDK